jgi:hypothetical protein
MHKLLLTSHRIGLIENNIYSNIVIAEPVLELVQDLTYTTWLKTWIKTLLENFRNSFSFGLFDLSTKSSFWDQIKKRF